MYILTLEFSTPIVFDNHLVAASVYNIIQLLYGWACPPGAVSRGQYTFFRTGKFWRKNFWVDLNEIKGGLGVFLLKKFEQ